jgi:hypothetical protein
MSNTLFEYLCAKYVKGANQSKRYVSRLSTLFLWTNIVCLSARNSAEKRGIGLQKTWLWAAKLQLSLAHRTVRWCTGQCPMHQAGPWWTCRSLDSTTAYGYSSPDYPVVHRTVRWANGRQRNGRACNPRATRGCSNGQLGAPDCSVCIGQCPVRHLAQRSNGRLCPNWNEIVHRSSYSGCSVAHRTVQCATRQKARIAFLVGLQRLLAALGL